MNKKAAHTLIEIIVVLTLISVLTTLIFSSVKNIRSRVNRATCIKNLKSLHQAVLLFATDTERNMADILADKTSPDFPSTNEFSTNYDISDANYKNSIISKYAASSIEKLKCPLTDTHLGYILNSNLIGINNTSKNKNNQEIKFENFISSNILIFECQSDFSPAYRHNGRCFGININGDINFDIKTPQDLENKNP